MGEQGKAEMLFKNLIRKHSEYTEGYYYLGLLYAEQKKYKEAAEILEEGSIKDPLNNRLFYNLGIIYHQHLQNMTKAEATLLRAYSLSPNDFDIMYGLSDFYIKKKTLQRQCDTQMK